MPTTKIDHEARFAPSEIAMKWIRLATAVSFLATAWILNIIWPYNGENVWGGSIDLTAYGRIGAYIIAGLVVAFIFVRPFLIWATTEANRELARQERAATGFKPGMSDDELRSLWF